MCSPRWTVMQHCSPHYCCELHLNNQWLYRFFPHADRNVWKTMKGVHVVSKCPETVAHLLFKDATCSIDIQTWRSRGSPGSGREPANELHKMSALCELISSVFHFCSYGFSGGFVGPVTQFTHSGEHEPNYNPSWNIPPSIRRLSSSFSILPLVRELILKNDEEFSLDQDAAFTWINPGGRVGGWHATGSVAGKLAAGGTNQVETSIQHYHP